MKELEDFLKNKSIQSDHTRRSYRTCLTKLLKEYNINTIEDFRKLKLIDLENWLASMPIKISSYNQHLRSLQSFCTWLKNHDFIVDDLSKKISFMKDKESTGDIEYDNKRKAKQQTYLNDEEIEKIISCAKTLDQKLRIALMASMGLRRSEVFKLRKEYVKGDMLLIPGKNGTFEELKMPPIVQYLISEYIKYRKDNSEFLIVSKMGKSEVKNCGTLYPMVKRLAKKAGIDPEKIKILSPHSFRRSMICNAVADDINMKTIQKMSRHKRMETTEIYAKALNNDSANKVFANMPMPDMEALKWEKI
jgi:integrase